MDYDTIENNWYKVKTAQTLVVDYALLRKDFDHLLKDKDDRQIDQWLIDHAAFFSEGQVQRMEPSGDLHDLLDLHDLSVHLEKTNQSAFRLRGGGRAAVFPLNNQYSICPDGRVKMDLLDVKGVGTTILQPSVSTKACGFLNFVDALKEMAYQKLIQRLSEKENEKIWKAVSYYAIIDTGIRFKQDVPNPATGYKGDRCVLVVRQAQSRIVSCFDEIGNSNFLFSLRQFIVFLLKVFYSVARLDQIKRNKSLNNFRQILHQYGLTSEQSPQALTVEDKYRTVFSHLSYLLEGGWNIQCDAPMTHLVDFSHFYTLPFSCLNPVWKMSHQAVQEAFKLGSPHLGVFEARPLCEYVWGTSDFEKAKQLFESEKETLQKKWDAMGKCGLRKPDNSWSWFLETDDSPVIQWCMREGMDYYPSEKTRNRLFNEIQSWLP